MKQSKTMKLPPHLEAKILATPGVVVRHAGRTEPASQKPQKAELLQPRVWRTFGALWIDVPILTVAEVNARNWKARSRRGGQAWRAVRQVIGGRLIDLGTYSAAYHEGHAVYARFTRIGGRRLDTSNLPTATKAVEDAIAYLIGADDGDPRWHPSFEQEPGGACGVRIRLSLEP